MTTLGAALAAARTRLAAAGIEEPALDARILLAGATGTSVERIVGWPETPLDVDAARRFDELVGRRAAREPIARILGRKEFWSLDLALGPDTLVPRPETETLVEAALAAMPAPGRAWRILDLGCGSGCVLLALLAERRAASGLGIDAAAGAVAVARANAAALGLAPRAAFRVGDWLAGVAERFDVVVANPPYVATGEIAGLAREVRDHDPRAALDGGPDGLDAYRAIASGLPSVLAAGGTALFEVGAGQAGAVEAILARPGLMVTARRRDLAGVERVVGVRRDA